MANKCVIAGCGAAVSTYTCCPEHAPSLYASASAKPEAKKEGNRA